MKLPAGITFEQTLLGSGDCTTVRGLENGAPVIVKSPDTSIDLFSNDLFDDDPPQENKSVNEFKSAKRRELQVAEQSEYFLKGRLEEKDGSIFWIRSFMQRSLYEKVAFKETPNSVELLDLCRAIIKALSELNQVDSSGHGNLSLGNVLIPNKNVHEIKLVDLLEADKNHTRADKRALGLIIYQLVNGEFVELADKIVSVPDDQDWKVLGTTEKSWREFCSELLNPYGKYADADWTEIDQALKTIKAAYSKRKNLKTTLIVSALVAFVGVVFLVWKIKFQEEKIVVDLDTIQGQWVELLDNYFAWGGNYLKSKSDFAEATDAEAFMDMFYDDKKARLPAKIIGRVSGQGARLHTAPEQVYQDSVRIDILALDNSKQQQIVLAHRFIMGLRSTIENWEVLQQLSEANKIFTDSGFEFGAKETQRLIDSISFKDGSLSLSSLYALKKSSESLDELQDLYTRFEAQVASLEALTESAFLPRYGDYLRQQLTKPAEDPVSHLRSLVDASAAVLEYWEQEKSLIAKDLFAKSERAFVLEPGFSGAERNLIKWKDMVKGFRLIEIPSLDSGREEFVAGRENIIQLNEQINELQEPDLAPARFDQQFEKLFKVFESDVDMPLIESNRMFIEGAVRKNLVDLKSLIEKTEDRWAEVNPDIGERLQQLSKIPEGMSPLLSPAWQAYMDREVKIRTEESFSGPREFIVFQRGYFSKLKNFEYFQDKQLSQLSPNWSSELLDAMHPDLIPGLQATRKVFYGELVAEWVDQIVPILLNTEDKLPIEAPTDVFVSRMEAFEVQLQDYAQVLSDALEGFDDWKLPEEGIEALWNSLNEGDLRKRWNQSEAFSTQVNQVKAYLDLNQKSEIDALIAFLTNKQNPAFARSLALEKISKLRVLSPAELGQIAETLSELSEQVPAAETDNYGSVLKSLWIKAFKNDALDVDSRKTVFAYYDVMFVRAVDLSGRSRFLFEIYESLAELSRNEKQYLEKPKLLKEIVNNFASLPDDSKEPELTGLLEALRAVDLDKVKETFENAPFIAKGWSVESETEEQLVLAWEDHRLVFHLVEAEEEEEKDFFIAELETSIELFNDWMTQKRLWDKSADSLPREWEVFLSQPYSAIDDYRQGMILWSIARKGLKRAGFTASSKWFEVDPIVADEYTRVEDGLFPVSAINTNMPIQQTGARLAHFFAESMGMSLPTSKQWSLAVEGYSADNAFFWQSRFGAELSKDLVDEIRSGSYYVERKIEESGYGVDHSNILVETNDQSDAKFKHLAGNVAEYLYDSETEMYYVAGGSAFSATASTWKDEHLVPKRNEFTAFSDVGVRLALIAPEQSAYMQFVNILNEVLK